MKNIKAGTVDERSLVSLEKDKDIQKLEKDLPMLARKVSDFKCMSAQALEEGAKFASTLREKISQVEDRRKFFVGPLNSHIKTINGFFKGLVKPLEEADRILTDKLLEYRDKEAKKIAKKNEKIEQKARAQAKAGVPVGDQVQPEFIEQAKSVDGGRFKKVWDFEVVDIKLIPREYLEPDLGVIGGAISKGKRAIPGIRIYEREVFVKDRL